MKTKQKHTHIYLLKTGQFFSIKGPGREVFKFHKMDGVRAYCTNKQGRVVYLFRGSECVMEDSFL